MGKEEYLAEQLAEHIKWFDKESTTHKQLYRRLRYMVFGLTACSTVLAGLAIALPAFQTPINIVIVFTTAAIGIVTSIEGLRKPSELWIHERTLYYSLKDLERELRYHSAGEGAPAIADNVYQRMQDVLGSARDRWNQQIAGRSTTDSPPSRAAPAPKKERDQ